MAETGSIIGKDLIEQVEACPHDSLFGRGNHQRTPAKRHLSVKVLIRSVRAAASLATLPKKHLHDSSSRRAGRFVAREHRENAPRVFPMGVVFRRPPDGVGARVRPPVLADPLSRRRSSRHLTIACWSRISSSQGPPPCRDTARPFALGPCPARVVARGSQRRMKGDASSDVPRHSGCPATDFVGSVRHYEYSDAKQ